MLGPNTIVLSDTTNNNLTSTSSDGLTYYYTTSATEIDTLKPGSIIISTKGEGDLKKVVSVDTTATGYTVQTTTATLEDAFEKLDITFQKTLTPADISTQKAPRLREGVSIKKSPI